MGLKYWIRDYTHWAMRSFVTEILIPYGQLTLKNQSQVQARDPLHFKQDQERKISKLASIWADTQE